MKFSARTVHAFKSSVGGVIFWRIGGLENGRFGWLWGSVVAVEAVEGLLEFVEFRGAVEVEGDVGMGEEVMGSVAKGD